MKQIDAEGIQLYPLPECDEDEDEDYKEQCRQLKVVFKFCNWLIDKKFGPVSIYTICKFYRYILCNFYDA